jgi:hypothetical protein
MGLVGGSLCIGHTWHCRGMRRGRGKKAMKRRKKREEMKKETPVK